MGYTAEFNDDVQVLGISYRKHLKHFYSHFGENTQKLKLLSEVLELRKELITMCQVFCRVEQLKLLKDCSYKKEQIHLYDDSLAVLENRILGELADVIVVDMQINDCDFYTSYKKVFKNEHNHFKILRKHNVMFNKSYVFNIVLDKIAILAKNLHEYDKDTGIKIKKFNQNYLNF